MLGDLSHYLHPVPDRPAVLHHDAQILRGVAGAKPAAGALREGFDIDVRNYRAIRTFHGRRGTARPRRRSLTPGYHAPLPVRRRTVT